MLIPQYSLRWLLGATTVCAVICSIFAVAMRGSLLAAAISMAIVALVVAATFYVLLFALVWLVSLVLPYRSAAADKKADTKPDRAILLALLLTVLPPVCSEAGAAARILVRKRPPRPATAAPNSGGVAAWTATGNGLAMNVGFESHAARPGYRPVRVSLLPKVPVTADRTLSIEVLLSRPAKGDAFDLRVVRDMEIPAGSGRVTATIPVPEFAGWNMQYAVNVSEDGAVLKALCIPWTSYTSQWIEAFPAVLFMGKSPPDTKKLAVALPIPRQNYMYGNQPPNQDGQTPLSTAESWPIEDFPDQWIDYSSFDIVCVSGEQLAALQQAQPGAFHALVAWTAAGGNLWVYGLGNDWRQLPKLEELLGLATEPGEPGPSAPPGWTAPEKSLYGRKPETAAAADDGSDENGAVALVNGKAVPAGATVAAKQSGQRPPAPKAGPRPPRRPRFVLRPFQAGLVVAMAAERPFPGAEIDWRWLLDSMGVNRWQWFQRHGLSLETLNPDFWNFLIPGVGMAPVGAFCVLISVFVIAIGPANYWLLRRRRQLHLLLLTIPVSASLVTLLLFAYAVAADGLDVRVRARSLTHLDQRNGRAVCWTRLSYFAGLSPRGGLRFPGDTAVFPLEQSPGLGYQEPSRARDLVWDDGQTQQWASGWLASRTPTQFLTVRTRPSDCGLDLLDAAGKEKAPAVRNRLQTPIQRLVVRTKEGKYYQAASVAAGATATLEPIPTAAGARLKAKLQDDLLLTPPGMAQAAATGAIGSSAFAMHFSSGGPSPTQASGRLEQMRTLDGMLPGSYVALVDRSPEVVLGVPSPREEPSSHVIVGQW